MTGRIRSIKPEILEDEKTAGLTHLEWRLFVSLWLIADDHGNLRGEPNYVLGQCLWSSRESRETVERALETLAELALVTPYTVRGQSYLAITNWDKHQRIDHKGKPRMPLLSMADPSSRDVLEKPSRESREGLAPDLRSPISDLRPPTTDQDSAVSPRSKQSRSHRILQDWKPERSPANLAAEQQAGARGVDLGLELQKLHDWATSTNAKKADWNATWRNWTRNARPSSGARAPNNSNPTQIAMDELARLEREEILRQESS